VFRQRFAAMSSVNAMSDLLDEMRRDKANADLVRRIAAS